MIDTLQPYEIQSLKHESMVRKLQDLVQNDELKLTKTALDDIIKVIDDIIEDRKKDDYSSAYDKGYEQGYEQGYDCGFEKGYEQAVAEYTK